MGTVPKLEQRRPMTYLKRDRDACIRMEFLCFINSIILIPCRVVRRTWSVVVRIIRYQPTPDRLFGAWNTIKRTALGQVSVAGSAERLINESPVSRRQRLARV